MSLVPKRSGPTKSLTVSKRLHERACRFADKEGFTLGSVVETALEEFLDDREDDGTGDEKEAPKRLAVSK